MKREINGPPQVFPSGVSEITQETENQHRTEKKKKRTEQQQPNFSATTLATLYKAGKQRKAEKPTPARCKEDESTILQADRSTWGRVERALIGQGTDAAWMSEQSDRQKERVRKQQLKKDPKYSLDI